MKGILWAVIAILGIVVAQLFGKAGKTKAKAAEQKAETAEKEKEIAHEVSPIAVEAARKQSRSEAEYDQTVEELGRAKQSNDIDAIYRIAQKAVQKALSLGAREAE